MAFPDGELSFPGQGAPFPHGGPAIPLGGTPFPRRGTAFPHGGRPVSHGEISLHCGGRPVPHGGPASPPGETPVPRGVGGRVYSLACSSRGGYKTHSRRQRAKNRGHETDTELKPTHCAAWLLPNMVVQ